MQQILDALGTALEQIAAFLPILLGAIVVLVVGWLLAGLLRRLTRRGLQAVGFNRLVERGRVSEVMERSGTRYEPARIVASVVYWTVLIATLLLVANILGLVAVSDLLTDLVAFLPNIFAAVLILVVALAIGQLAYEAIEASFGEEVSVGTTIANVAKYGIIAFGVLMVLNQLQVAPTIVSALFIIVFGALALSFAIAFGIGNIDLARDIGRDWYQRTQAKTQEIREGAKPLSAEELAERVQQETEEAADKRRPAA